MPNESEGERNIVLKKKSKSIIETHFNNKIIEWFSQD